MARIPYADIDTPETRPLVERIVEERGSVLHLYQMLLHSPPVAEGWLEFLTAVRQKCALAADIRELAIMRVASLNGASYEADQHAPIALAVGVSQRQLDSLDAWEGAHEFTPRQRAALALTDSMTRAIQVPPALMADVRRHFPDREAVELVATIAAYNMVSRFLEALAIHSDDVPGS